MTPRFATSRQSGNVEAQKSRRLLCRHRLKYEVSPQRLGGAGSVTVAAGGIGSASDCRGAFSPRYACLGPGSTAEDGQDASEQDSGLVVDEVDAAVSEAPQNASSSVVVTV